MFFHSSKMYSTLLDLVLFLLFTRKKKSKIFLPKKATEQWGPPPFGVNSNAISCKRLIRLRMIFFLWYSYYIEFMRWYKEKRWAWPGTVARDGERKRKIKEKLKHEKKNRNIGPRRQCGCTIEKTYCPKHKWDTERRKGNGRERECRTKNCLPKFNIWVGVQSKSLEQDNEKAMSD